MINTQNYSANKAYFAAANGYSGFRSLFGEIFDSEKMSRIYVLKGGPGTGKSTMLKGLLLHSAKRGYFSEAIYCSSDPKSLDGVIISSGRGRIAVLDGTAPHERDAIIPGAVDEIINLGDGFDIEMLSSRRDKITELLKKKKAAYKRAYSHLDAAGAIWRDITVYFRDSRHYSEAELRAKELCQYESVSEETSCKRLYTSAFGAGGYIDLRPEIQNDKKLVRLDLPRASGRITMMILKRLLSKIGAIEELHLSPFSDDIPERIVTENEVFMIAPPGAPGVLANDETGDQTLKELFEIHDRLLELSKLEFAEASRNHFELEGIYSDAVSFAHNDAVFERLSKSVDRILDV